MSEEVHRARPTIPPAVRVLVLAVGTLSVLAGAFSIASLGLKPHGFSWFNLAAGLLVALLLVPTRLLSISFPWRHYRFAVNADEALLVVAFVLLPPGLVVIAAMVGCAIAETVRRPDALKSVFNVGAYTLAAAVAGGAYTAGLTLGLKPIAAALVIPPVASLVSHALLSQVISFMEGESMLRVFVDRFIVTTTTSSFLGIAVGSSFLALYSVHPFLLFALVPTVYLAWHSARTEARQEHEIGTRRALAGMSRELVGCQDVDRVADSVLATCVGVFDCHAATLVLEPDAGERVERVRTVDGEGPAPSGVITADIAGVTGLARGFIRITPRQGANPPGDYEQELANAVAAATAAAVETAGILNNLETARERLDTYLNASRDIILVVEPGPSVRFANAQARALLDLDEAEDPGDLGRLLAGFDPAGGVWEGARTWESRLVASDGSERVLTVNATPVSDKERETLIVARDVTEKVRLEAVEARQREVLARNERLAALGTLVAGVAHEVNNPLMYMRGNVDLVRMDMEGAMEDAESPEDVMLPDPADSVHRLERVSAGIDRLESIARNLKSVAQGSRVPSGDVDVAAVVKRVTDLVSYGLDPDVAILADVASDIPSVPGDAGALEQAFLNLVKNAEEAMQDRAGEIRVRVRREEEDIVIAIEDEGVGIPERERRDLFTPFFTTKHEGTGLGLALVHSTIQAHGGTITVDSEEGQGTTFTVKLPVAGAPGSEPAPAPEATMTSGGGGLHGPSARRDDSIGGGLRLATRADSTRPVPGGGTGVQIRRDTDATETLP